MLLAVYTRLQLAWLGFREDLRERMSDESGAVATEYVLLLALIALVITVGMVALAAAINAKFNASAACLNAGAPC